MTQKTSMKFLAALAAICAVGSLFIVVGTLDTQKRIAERITETFTPADALGVPADHMTIAAPLIASFPKAFMADENKPDHSRSNVRLWDVVRSVELTDKPLGADFGCGPQQTGDCVSWGLARCLSDRLAIQTYKKQSRGGDGVFQPYLYGVARVNNGKTHFACNSAGAYPSVAAQSLATFGYIVLADNPPAYSGRLADDWGCRGAPAKWVEIGKTRAGGSVYPIRTTDELRDAICNGYPCTIAVSFRPGSKYTADGRNCLNWNGRNLGGHQMCVTGYDGSLGPGREYFYVQNSHGPKAQAACDPLQNEPLGGFWITLRTCQDWLAEGESWAISDVAGFPVEEEINWSSFDRFRVQAQPKEVPNEGKNVRRGRAAVRSVSLGL